MDQIKSDVKPSGEGCAECLKEGLKWVNLRMCLVCGNVGCCDSSIGNHATKHYEQTGHPIMQAYKTDDPWRWCYVDQAMV